MKNFEEVSLILKSQSATPKPPISSVLGQRGINIMNFCNEFNKVSKIYKKNSLLSVRIKILTDKSYKFIVKSPTTSYLLKEMLNLKKGSNNNKKIAYISDKEIKDIYHIKKKDFNSYNYKSAKKIIIGSAKSMGIKYDNKKYI
ncbi:uL11 family ribosomal protein [Candidatus Vidania fulgoroideorum]